MRRAAAAWLIVALFDVGVSAPGMAAEPPGNRIEHVIVLLQQDQTFDSLFGTYPGANGVITQGIEVQLPDEDGRPVTLHPRDWSSEAVAVGETVSNGQGAAVEALDGGLMDGFVRAQTSRGRRPEPAMGYETEQSVPVLFSLASQFTLFDNYYSSVLGGSLPNMLTLISGDDQGLMTDGQESLAELRTSGFPTLFDQLTDRQISWRLYHGKLDAALEDVYSSGSYLDAAAATPPMAYWAPVVAINRFWETPDLSSNIVDLGEFHSDAAAGTLPTVSFVLPSPTNHLQTAPGEWQRQLAGVINDVFKSPDWSSTALFILWDDWGGLYDHVVPPEGRGFRVPALLVSPWAKPGYVSSEAHDHIDVLAFISDLLDLPPLAARQTAAAWFTDAFDFSSEPIAPRLLEVGSLPPTPVAPPATNRAVLGLFVFGLLLLGSLVAAAVTWHRRRPVVTAWVAGPNSRAPAGGPATRPRSSNQPPVRWAELGRASRREP